MDSSMPGLPVHCSNSCPLSRWCPPTISSSVVPFFSHFQSFPASGSLPMSQVFASGGQRIGVFPGGDSGKNPTCQCRRLKRCRFDPWIGTIPWRRKRQPTPVIFPGASRGQRSLVGYIGSQRTGQDWSDSAQHSMALDLETQRRLVRISCHDSKDAEATVLKRPPYWRGRGGPEAEPAQPQPAAAETASPAGAPPWVSSPLGPWEDHRFKSHLLLPCEKSQVRITQPGTVPRENSVGRLNRILVKSWWGIWGKLTLVIKMRLFKNHISLFLSGCARSSLLCSGSSLQWLLLLLSTGSGYMGFSSFGTQAELPPTCGICLHQILNPRPLYWQADSYPLHHQGSPPNTSIS